MSFFKCSKCSSLMVLSRASPEGTCRYCCPLCEYDKHFDRKEEIQKWKDWWLRIKTFRVKKDIIDLREGEKVIVGFFRPCFLCDEGSYGICMGKVHFQMLYRSYLNDGYCSLALLSTFLEPFKDGKKNEPKRMIRIEL